MATTAAYSASLCTRKTGSSSNAKSGSACQEYYESSYNYVGIISFSGMNLANKVIQSIWISVDAAKVPPKPFICARPTTRTASRPA